VSTAVAILIENNDLKTSGKNKRLKERRSIYVAGINHDHLCGLVVRVPGYTTEMYCDSCEVRTEFIYVM
jgi:hypothetical protein